MYNDVLKPSELTFKIKGGIKKMKTPKNYKKYLENGKLTDEIVEHVLFTYAYEMNRANGLILHTHCSTQRMFELNAKYRDYKEKVEYISKKFNVSPEEIKREPNEVLSIRFCDEAYKIMEEIGTLEPFDFDEKVLVPEHLLDKDKNDAEFQEWLKKMRDGVLYYLDATEDVEDSWRFYFDSEGRKYVGFEGVYYKWFI